MDPIQIGGAIASVLSMDALGATKEIFEIARDAIRRNLSTGTERMQVAVAEEIATAVLQEWPQLTRQVQRLQEHTQGREPTYAAMVTIFEEFTKTYARAEGDKRRLLLNALNNAFDPALYEQGMTRRLLAALDAVDYGDLHCLRELSKKVGAMPWSKPATPESYHATRLHQAMLVHRQVQHSVDRGLTDLCEVTAFGQRMLELIAEPDRGVSQ